MEAPAAAEASAPAVELESEALAAAVALRLRRRQQQRQSSKHVASCVEETKGAVFAQLDECCSELGIDNPIKPPSSDVSYGLLCACVWFHDASARCICVGRQ